MSKKILIVDDEDSIRFSLRGVLEDEGFAVVEAASGEEALARFDELRPDLVFLDIWMPGMDGLAVLEKLKPAESGVPVVMISGHGTIETAVHAVKAGAFDFIEKPLSLEKVVLAVNRALDFGRLARENQALKSSLGLSTAPDITGASKAVEKLRGEIAKVAPTNAWVLITGENGAGKEIIARSIHRLSKRADSPLVAVNCAAIPDELIESELFGHEKGSFTGADKAKVGKFETAHTGTLFLDEIGDMSLKTQAKILRILQERSFERVGGHKTIHVDVRVIAATNKNLQDEIKAGRFREDLYYRLAVFPITAPPLRDRREDIPLFIAEFTDRMSRENAMKPIEFTPEALEAVMGRPWPGNVRELKNFVERMHILHMGKTIDYSMLPEEFGKRADCGETYAAPAGPVDFKSTRQAFEVRFFETKLKEFGGNMAALADAVGLERSYLYKKLKNLGLGGGEAET